MTFDELQKKWQSQKDGGKLSINSDLLFKEVRRNKKSFESSIFWRDFREVGACIPVAIFFFYCGMKMGIWSLFIAALSMIVVGAFLVIDRIFVKRRQPKFNSELMSCIESSLAEVKHQIWLLKNVLWWYLLPPGIGIGVFLLHFAFLMAKSLEGKPLVHSLLFTFAYAIFCVFFCWGVYWLNQRAVRKVLFPRKQELEQLLASISEN
jgi:hypothetical protein